MRAWKESSHNAAVGRGCLAECNAQRALRHNQRNVQRSGSPSPTPTPPLLD